MPVPNLAYTLERSRLSTLIAQVTQLNAFATSAADASRITQLHPGMAQPPVVITVTSSTGPGVATRYRIVASSRPTAPLFGYVTVSSVDAGELFDVYARETFVAVSPSPGADSATFEFDYPLAGTKTDGPLRFTLADKPLDGDDTTPATIYWFDPNEFLKR